MSATIIDGKAAAERVGADVAREIEQLIASGERAPSLAVVLCNDNDASAMYVRNKGRAAERAGMRFQLLKPPLSSTTDELVSLVRELDSDDEIDGVLVQLPLPHQVDADLVSDSVDPQKDVDGFHPLNFGMLAEGRHRAMAPGTPAGCMELLRAYDIPIRGRRAVVVGRSVIVGRPLALLLMNADATVTVCHTKTENLADVCREADILVSATGKPRSIDAGFVKPGACVIDVGITSVDGKVVGDVDRESVEPVAGWLTPVPGGVGPMTIAMLLRATLERARSRQRVPPPG